MSDLMLYYVTASMLVTFALLFASGGSHTPRKHFEGRF